jgi:predicted outer membrane repeat protein
VALAGAAFVGVSPAVAGAASVSVSTEGTFTSAWQASGTTEVDLSTDVTLTCTSGEPTRNSSTAIVVNGNGHTLTQTCSGDSVLRQQGDGTVTLTDITLTGGDGGNGGALDTTGNVVITRSTLTGNNAESEGGAIEADGSGVVDVTDSTISDNTSGNSGGGIAAQGLITLTRSTVSGNTSGNNGGALRAYGGAAIINSTVSGNTASSDGGAVSGGPVTLVYATVTDNTGAGGGNLELDDEGLTSFGSVVATPHGSADCVAVGTTTSNGYNVDDDGTCGFKGTGDQSDLKTALALGALADNGGPAPTLMPAATSPLVDQIPTAACGGGLGITTDERGAPRPFGAACDIGAVEAGAAIPASTTTVPATTLAPSASSTSTTAAPDAVAATPVAATPTFTG